MVATVSSIDGGMVDAGDALDSDCRVDDDDGDGVDVVVEVGATRVL